MAQALVFSYTYIRDWVPIIPLSVGVVLLSFWVLVGAVLYLVFRLIRAICQNFIPAESFRANNDQWLKSSSSSSSSNWCSLPEDLVIDQILSRLPVKSLMRFKSVCKRWYSLPTNPSFIASHLKHSTTCNTLASWNANIGPPMFDHIFSLRAYSLAFQPVNLNFGFDRKPDVVLGPCDGLFCLYWKPCWEFRSWTDYTSPERIMALWNPATRAFSILPMSKLDRPPYKTVEACLVGFGFDLTAKSIKVVKFVGFARDTNHDYNINCAEVYDVGSGSWRVIHVDDTAQAVFDLDDPTHCWYNNKDGVFHWLAYRRRGINEVVELLVLSFDMSRDLFHVTLMPDKYNPLTPCWRQPIMKLKECQFSLSRDSLAVHFSLFEANHGTVEIWVMKKDFYRGVEGGESFSYSLSHELTVELPYPRPCLSMGVWKKNELLLWEVDVEVDVRSEKTPFLYDIVTKQARDLAHLGELNFFTYKESLVSVNGGCGNNNGCVPFL